MHGEKNKAIARLMALPAQLPLPDHMQPNGAQGPWLGHAPRMSPRLARRLRNKNLLTNSTPSINSLWQDLGVPIN